MSSPKVDASYLQGLRKARGLIGGILQQDHSTPLLIRLAVHDAFAYDAQRNTFGANASIRTQKELSHPGNEGLKAAVDALAQVKKEVPLVSSADLYQLAGLEAVRRAGGPEIPFRPGRKDAWTFPPQSAYLSPNTSKEPLQHFTRWCSRTGLPLASCVALLGAHCIGRWWPDRDGAYSLPHETLADPVFSNHYFRMLLDGDLPQDEWLLTDPSLEALIRHYAGDQEAFFKEYSDAHEKLSRLGTRVEAASEPLGEAHDEDTQTQLISDTAQYVAAAGLVIVGGLVAYGLWRRRRRAARLR